MKHSSMYRPLFFLLFFAFAAYGQQKLIAIINTVDDGEPPVEHSELSHLDARDGKKYKVVKIGSQTWMAENLNYDASGSKCYDNKPANLEVRQIV